MTWRTAVRLFVLYTLKAVGGFAVARRATRHALRILAYHGFSLVNEHAWRPQLFIRGRDFERRVRHLIAKGYPVLPLDEALRALQNGSLPPRATIITIDDGFFSTYASALPVLRQHGIPATLYLATYYVVHEEPVFNLAVSYMLWNARTPSLDAAHLGLPGLGVVRVRGCSAAEHRTLVEAIVARATDSESRAALLHRLACLLDCDLEALCASRMLGFIDISEARRLHDAGVKLAMHTHRHRSPATHGAAMRELTDNREVITAITGTPPSHFCFPSGDCASWSDAWLAEAGIESATTTAAGFNYSTTNRYRLHRFLDSHRVFQIEFEAELAGVLEIGRRFRALVQRLAALRGRAALVAPCLAIALMASIHSASAAPLDEALAAWKRHMLEYGARHCAALDDPRLTADDRLAATYYDQLRVMAGIADYTGQPRWQQCAVRVRAIYRDAYVLANDAKVPGYWNFTTGLRMDYERTGDATSRLAVIKLANNAAYCRDSTPAESSAPHIRSREAAYCIVALINAETVGGPARRRRAGMVTQAYGHLDQWFVRFEWSGDDLAPFMVGLTAHALIRDWEQTRDPRLIPALRRAADWLWTNAWVPRDRSMWYRSGDRVKGAPDLNLLIAPMYAFLYRHTGETMYRITGDQLFEAGVALAWLDGAKQFNQQYWWSFDFVKWRVGVGESSRIRPMAP